MKCEGEAKAHPEKTISVLFLRVPFSILGGAAVRSGRQAPLFVLAAGGGRGGRGVRGNYPVPPVLAS